MPLAKFKPRPVLGLEPPGKSSRMKRILYLCAITLMRAVEKYFKEIGTSQDFTNRLNSRFDCDITRQNDRIDHYDEEDKWAALVSNGKRFRKDRAFIWDLLERPFASTSTTMRMSENGVDTEEEVSMSKLAAAAMHMIEDVPQERLKQDLAAAQKELASTKRDLENVRYYEKVLLQSRELSDAVKRADTTQAKLQEALLANGRLENRFRTVEGRLKSSDEQAKKLELEVGALKEENAQMKKLLGQKTAKEIVRAGDGFAK